MNIRPTMRGKIGFLKETNDCSVRAVANAANIDYEMAFATLRHYGRQDCKGALTRAMAKAYKELGLKLLGVFGSSQAAENDYEDLSSLLGEDNVKRYAGMTAKRFIDSKFEGSFVCCSNNHAFAVIDGHLVDLTPINQNIRITFIYKV